MYILLTCLDCAALAAEPATPTKSSGDGPAAVKSSPKFTLDLDAMLADPAGRSAKLDDERQALQAIVDASRLPADQAAAHLALANWLLAKPTATPATRWLIGMETAEDRQTLTALAKVAQKHLNAARQKIDAQREAIKEANGQDESSTQLKDRIRELKASLRKLEPFAELLATAGSNSDDEDRRSAWSRAARGMAGLREAADDELAASALLWQSFAWEKAGRHDRALLSLPTVLKKPKQASYDFMNRLLRCRTLIDAKQYAAATALAIRIRAACPNWFPREDAQAIVVRQRFAALLQFKTGTLWMAEFRAAGDYANADRLEAMLAEIQQSLFADPDARPAVYHLGQVLPIIAEPPTIEPESRPAEQPATQTTHAK